MPSLASLNLGRAVLSPWGTLVLHDLVRHNTAALVQQPWFPARRVDGVCGWPAEGRLSGALELAFDGPGIPSIGEIEDLKRMLERRSNLCIFNSISQVGRSW